MKKLANTLDFEEVVPGTSDTFEARWCARVEQHQRLGLGACAQSVQHNPRIIKWSAPFFWLVFPLTNDGLY
jgi:hypothetical protein